MPILKKRKGHLWKMTKMQNENVIPSRAAGEGPRIGRTLTARLRDPSSSARFGMTLSWSGASSNIGRNFGTAEHRPEACAPGGHVVRCLRIPAAKCNAAAHRLKNLCSDFSGKRRAQFCDDDKCNSDREQEKGKELSAGKGSDQRRVWFAKIFADDAEDRVENKK